uniref:Cation-transporting P-type ATPase C-terminal domain-containing protein n=1 Tax=Nelumbo nucifera TaxID=4432 RepID=A0A822XAL9_NELNU|nr:TPA_asm: hypothetical protein HUJ06_019937 [Nelumbo nucifera]
METLDIIIAEGNFNSVIIVLKRGRCIYSNIQKFIQFQLIVNVAALVINFIEAVSSSRVPLTAIQLLWVHLIMDVFGALALAVEQPTEELMEKPPVDRSKSNLINSIMYRNLIGQALYQVAVLMVLHFNGSSIFEVSEKINDTLMFNTFVLYQIFNLLNARKLKKKNILGGIHKENRFFLGIVMITVEIAGGRGGGGHRWRRCAKAKAKVGGGVAGGGRRQ